MAKCKTFKAAAKLCTKSKGFWKCMKRNKVCKSSKKGKRGKGRKPTKLIAASARCRREGKEPFTKAFGTCMRNQF